LAARRSEEAVEGREVRDQVAIVGLGQTDYSRESGRSELRLAVEAIHAAVADAGLRVEDIDGIVKYSVDSSGDPPTVAAALGLPDLGFWALASGAGTGSCAIVGHAANALLAGQAQYVVCYRAMNGHSGRRYGAVRGEPATHVGGGYTFGEFSQPYGLVAPAQFYSMLARRHMIEYGTTQDALGQIAIACRRHAARTAHAQMRTEFDLPEYHASRWIAEPLHLLDCCLTTDGAAAIVLTTTERARDLAQRPVLLSSWGQAAGPGSVPGMLDPWLMREKIAETTGRYLAPRLYRMAGLGPDEIDVAQIYDCFTITVLLQLEDYGFCAKGEAADFIGDGAALTLGGALPLNTAGGNLSEGYIHGFNHVLEGTRQMRATSQVQVEDAAHCLVTGGAPVPTSALILTRA
jgi:acetyl-CoA acetyltransferase